jgi:hypothetical protein
VKNTFPLFFIKLNRSIQHVNMPGGCTLSAHGAGKLIVKTGRQTKAEKDMYAELCETGNSRGNAGATTSHSSVHSPVMLKESKDYPNYDEEVQLRGGDNRIFIDIGFYTIVLPYTSSLPTLRKCRRKGILDLSWVNVLF